MRNSRSLKKQRNILDYLFFNGYRFEVSIETLIFIAIVLITIFIAFSIPNTSVALIV